jgi:myosin heavy subunit
MAPRNGDKGRRDHEDGNVKADWVCKSCTNRAGKPWRNAGSLKECGNCHIHKGAAFGQVVECGPGESPTTSTRQRVAKQMDVGKELAAMRAELKKASAANAKLEAALAASVSPASAAAGTPGSAMEVENDNTHVPADLVAAVEQAKDELRQMEAFSEFNRSLIPDFPAKLSAARAKLDEACANKRAANPLKQRLESAEVHQAKSAKKLAAVKATLAAKEEELAALQEAIKKQNDAVTAAAANVAKADAEVALLAAQFASERSAAADTSTVSGGSVAPAPEGYVLSSFAEAKWQEREAQFAAQMAAVEALVLGKPAEAAASAAPSEASDVQDVACLEFECEDEEWKRVSRDARKAIAAKHRSAIAGKVATCLGKVNKHANPFQKPDRK